MATRKWKGKAKDVLQVDTVTIADTWAAADTVTFTIDGIDFVVTIGGLITTAQVAQTLYEAFNGASTFTDTTASCSPTLAQGGAQAIPQLAEMVATVSGSVVTLTGRTAGKPVTYTVTESTAGTGTATLANSVTATGSNWWSNADNWTGDTVPVDSDTVIFDSGDVDCKYGLSTGIQPLIFKKTKGYSGKIGLPEINSDDRDNPYNEYRTKYLTFDDNSVTGVYHFEEGEGSGSQLVRIDCGAGRATWHFYGYGSRLLTSQPCILLLGTHANNEINVPQGDVGVAFFDGETSTLLTVRAGSSAITGSSLRLGDGVTLTGADINIGGASVYIDSATATADIDLHSGGTLYITGTGAHANIDVQHGTCHYNSSGTITTLTVRSAGKFDRSGDLRGATITNAVQLYKGANIQDPNKSLTLSNGFVLNGCTLADVTLNFGTDRTYTVA